MNFNQEIERLKSIKSYQQRNSILTYILESGGLEGFRKKYKSWKQFSKVLEGAGYSRRYIRELKEKFKSII
jgi:hypothetical protein